jgi:hypothetical protein
MKKILIILFFPAGCAFGQTDLLNPALKMQNQKDRGLDIQKFQFFNVPEFKAQPFLEDNNLKEQIIKNLAEAYASTIDAPEILKGWFSHKGAPGASVFIMEPDKMPCLVPDLNMTEKILNRISRDSRMAEPMPNFGPRIELVPQKK